MLTWLAYITLVQVAGQIYCMKHSCSVLTRKVIKLIWVPAHVGIRGNEMAGTGAKQALKQGTVEMALSKMEAKSIDSTDDEKEAAAQVRQQVKVKTLM